MSKDKTNDVFCIKLNQHFRQHLEDQADKKKIKLGTYVKAMLKKHTKYKEPEIV